MHQFFTTFTPLLSKSRHNNHQSRHIGENLIVPLDMSPPPVRGGGAVSFSWTRCFEKLQLILSLLISDIICNFYWLMTQHVERLRNSWRHPNGAIDGVILLQLLNIFFQHSLEYMLPEQTGASSQLHSWHLYAPQPHHLNEGFILIIFITSPFE